MSIAVKAVQSFSATAATSAGWTLTVSVSTALGDILVLATAYRGSASHSLGTIVDNANNAWSRAIEASSAGMQSGIFYAPVTSLTSSLQIALVSIPGRTISARAAHLLVLTGVDAAAPYDAATGASGALLSSTATTATLSTSAATGLDNELLVVTAHQNAIGSATMAADAAWIAQGGAVDAAGAGQSLKIYLWTRAAGGPGVYQFSASLSNGGAARSRQLQIAGFRPLPAGSASASTTLSFAASGTLAAPTNIQGTGGMGLTAQALPQGGAAGQASAALSFTSQFDVSGTGELEADVAIAIGSATTLSMAASATGDRPVASSSLGGGWNRELFRKILERHRRRLQSQAHDLVTTLGDLDAATERPSAIASKLAALELAPLHEAARLHEQAQLLSTLERSLKVLGDLIERERGEGEAEDMLLLAA